MTHYPAFLAWIRPSSLFLAASAVVCAGLLLAMTMTGCGSGQDESASGDNEYADDMAEQHEGDTPEASAAAREPAIPVTAEVVEYTTTGGDAVSGYIAAPSNPDSVLAARGLDPDSDAIPGVVVIHEWWGLNDNIRTAARRLAGEGYRVLAVDLYGGSTAETPDEARSLMQDAMQDTDRLAANLSAANDYLKAETGASRTAVMGWCFGGAMTLTASMAQPDGYAGAVVYYGRVEGITEEDIQAISFPVIGFFGADDGGIPVESVRAFESTMDAAGKDINVHIYDGAGHAFANPSGTRYDADAAEDAWRKTTAFLQDQLYGTAAASTDAR